jgi:hypothetical protein
MNSDIAIQTKRLSVGSLLAYISTYNARKEDLRVIDDLLKLISNNEMVNNTNLYILVKSQVPVISSAAQAEYFSVEPPINYSLSLKDMSSIETNKIIQTLHAIICMRIISAENAITEHLKPGYVLED